MLKLYRTIQWPTQKAQEHFDEKKKLNAKTLRKNLKDLPRTKQLEVKL